MAYKLNPCTSQLLLAHEGSSVSRAGFGRYSVWVTQNDENRRWPGGDYPLQNVNEEGLPRWVEEDRTITDPVVWHVFGTTHIPRPEDFPVCPHHAMLAPLSLPQATNSPLLYQASTIAVPASCNNTIPIQLSFQNLWCLTACMYACLPFVCCRTLPCKSACGCLSQSQILC